MFRFAVFSAAVAAALGQDVAVDEQGAKILKEQRFSAGDLRHGAAYATENQILFKEESDEDGERTGFVSYIGDDGKTYSYRYYAGKEGFRILDGDHIPSGGQDAAAYNAEEAAASTPVEALPTVETLPIEPLVPAFEAAPVAPVAPAVVPEFVDYDDEPVAARDPDFNPFINPHDPTHRNLQFNKNARKFAPKVPGVLDDSHVPDCAGCAGVNPFINPFDLSHQQAAQQPGLLAGHLAGHLAGAGRPAVRTRPAVRARPAIDPRPVEVFPETTTTPAPRRFFPPGSLALNRFETGFNFDFSS